VLEVERWAEVRRMSRVERPSQREISKRTGLHRGTIKRALDAKAPPSYGSRSKAPSKLDPFGEVIEGLLAGNPKLSGFASLRRSGPRALLAARRSLTICCVS